MATTQFVTAPDDSAHGNVDEFHFESRFFYFERWRNIATSFRSNAARHRWTDHQDMCEGLKCGKVVENHRVYWLPGSAAESTDGAPLSMKFRVARLVVEATTDSETDFDVNATQLEESEETRRLKHDARQIAHL